MSAHRRTRIKICGVQSREIAMCAVDAGADALGFVFAPSSPRLIEPGEAASIIFQLPPFVASVALTVDLPAEHFAELHRVCPTDFHQLHGKESVKLARACGGIDVSPVSFIKAIRFDETTIDNDLARWDGVDEVKAILIDGSRGGLGETFDWSSLTGRDEHCAKPIILAGGLTPDNVEEAIRLVHPFAVDVSSGVERERGVKDLDLIAAFCQAVHRSDKT